MAKSHAKKIVPLSERRRSVRLQEAYKPSSDEDAPEGTPTLDENNVPSADALEKQKSEKGKKKVTEEKKNESSSSKPDDKVVWENVAQRKMIDERNIDESDFREMGLYSLLENQQLLPTVTYVEPYVKAIVQEFYADLMQNTGDPRAEKFAMVCVRGHHFLFSAEAINDFLRCHRPEQDCTLDFDVVVRDLTGGSKDRCTNFKSFKVSDLSTKYSILFKLALLNWLPSLHSSTISKTMAALLYKVGHSILFDVGSLIFGQIMDIAERPKAHALALPFPALIYGMIVHEKGIVLPTDDYEPTQPFFTISQKHKDENRGDIEEDNEIATEDDDGDGDGDAETCVADLSGDAKDMYLAHLEEELDFLKGQKKEILRREREVRQIIASMQ